MKFIIENVIAKNDQLRIISTDGHEVRIDLEGDCCSSSFFDDFSLIDARGLMGERLMSIEDTGRDEPENDPYKEGCDVIEYHALVVRTDKQSITIDWRNDSNGYYSGVARIFFDGLTCRSYSWQDDEKDVAEMLA